MEGFLPVLLRKFENCDGHSFVSQSRFDAYAAACSLENVEF